VDPTARPRETAGDNFFPTDHFVFEKNTVTPDTQSMETFQFLGERLDIPKFLAESLDRHANGMTRLRRKLTEVIQHLPGKSDGDHNSLRTETGW